MSVLEASGAVVLRPGDTAYDEVRRVHNGMIDKRPALIVRCLTTEHVAAAVRFARARSLEISIRSCGHNVAGRAVCDGGLMIDLNLMKGATVDPNARTAQAQPGLNWGEFNAATQRHGLAVTGGTISTTGVAGLTLGGGFGWLMGKFGFAADNLLSAEVVTADGAILTASVHEHPDLFWALRGGGGNFGVVTSFTFKLYRVGPIVTGGFNFWPYKRAKEVLALFREESAKISDDMSLVAALVRSPDEPHEPLAGIIACHVGPEDVATRELAAIRGFGEPVVQAIIRKPYEDVNSQYDFGFPNRALNYWKSSFLKRLPDDAISSMVADFARCPSHMSILMLEDVHGAATRVPTAATAIPHRAAGFNLLIPSVWSNPSETALNVAWTQDTFARLNPFFAPGRYVNYLDDDEAQRGGDPVRAAYGANYERLVEVKTAYDPENVFHLNYNIPPRKSATR
ncbi:FAD-binding oxidoreductase [Conexibacter sp. S30A1]|uniref:FAD-binding oxidoreductase n=1 Tax=Conexibacter sp. S30A1 TaxID=2937800 RepID=UPI00200CC765|nr:FAD-binding oxidoreductase [Conexibacter sp. S30A1]